MDKKKVKLSLKGKKPTFLNYVIPILFSLVLSSVFCAFMGMNPIEQYVVIFRAAFTTQSGVMNTLGYAAPIIMAGIATSLSFVAGVFNCGIEGQIIIGSMFAAVAGYAVQLPHVWHVLFCFLCGAVGGMLYAIIPALLKAKLQINEVVTTIMLNNVAVHLTNFLANGPLNANYPFSSTPYIEDTAKLTRIASRYKVTSSLWVALALVVVVWFVMKRTRFGYELKFLGKQKEFADATGMHVSRKIITVFLISGCIAGICGASEIMGVHYLFLPSWDGGTMGWDGFYASILAGGSPIGTLIVAVLFGAFRYGGLALQSKLGTPTELIEIIKALIILFFSVKYISNKTDFSKLGKALGKLKKPKAETKASDAASKTE